MRFATLLLVQFVIGQFAIATSRNNSNSWIVKLAPGVGREVLLQEIPQQAQPEWLDPNTFVVQLGASNELLKSWSENVLVDYVQPNSSLHLTNNYEVRDKLKQAILTRSAPAESRKGQFKFLAPDNAEIPALLKSPTTPDSNLSTLVIAALETGIDYTHPLLVPQLWRNPGESGVDFQGRDKSTNGVDDDGNGAIDDVFGWDFVQNDNRPFDLAYDQFSVIRGAGNPGQGTHSAGLLVSQNSPEIRLMPLRVIEDTGEGTTANAVRALHYAVDNGAQILTLPWESFGEDPSTGHQNLALQEALQYAEERGVVVVVTESISGTSFPASYNFANFLKVPSEKITLFSDSRQGTTSTTVGGQESDKVIQVGGFEVGWSGASVVVAQAARKLALEGLQKPRETLIEVKHRQQKILDLEKTKLN